MDASNGARGSLSRRRLLGLAVAAGPVVAAGASACGGEEPTTPLPDDQVVFMVHGRAAVAPRVMTALSSPGLVVYGDGRVIRADRPDRGRRPLSYVEQRTDPLRVARFAADAAAAGLVQEGADYGSPQVTDLGTTLVTLHGAGDETATSVYGFFESIDQSVGWFARRNRRRLRNLVTRAEQLGGDAAAKSHRPDRVAVLELEPRDDAAADVPWPGPHPDTFLHPGAPAGRLAQRCGTLIGETAAAVYQAALENSGQEWLVGGTTRILVVNPLPIGLDC